MQSPAPRIIVFAFLALLNLQFLLAIPLPSNNVVPIGFANGGSSNIVYLRPMPDLYNIFMVGGPVIVGTSRKGEKPQEMRKTIFTLASGDFWVQDTLTKKAKHCPYDNPVDTFYPENSTTYRPANRPFATHSYKGQISGKVGIDTVQISPGVIAQNATIGQALDYDCFFIEQSVSGILGLGWPSLADKNLAKASPLFTALRTMPKPVFSLFIDSENEDGSITFGEFNTAECANEWKFAPLTKTGLWQFGISAFSIGTHAHKKPQQAILLESIPLILGQIEEIDRFTLELGPSAGYSDLSRSIVVGCKQFREGKLPNVTFQVDGDGIELTLTPKEYVNDFDLDGQKYCDTIFGYKKDYYGTKVLPGDLSGVNWVFGRPLMSKYCTGFDFAQKRVGFASVLKKKN